TRFSRDWSSDVCSSDLFDREVYEGLSEKLKAFIAESPEYKSLIGASQKRNGYAEQKGASDFHAPLDLDRQPEPAGEREFAPLDRSEERRVGKERRSGWG